MRGALLAAGVALAVLLAPRAQADAPNHPFFALCMDTHDSKHRTLEEQAQLLKELGYDGAAHLWADKVKERLATLDAAGLKLFQIYIQVNVAPGKEGFDPKLRDVFPLLKGRDVMVALLMSGRPPSDMAGDDRAVAIIREIADLAQDSGTRIVLYPHSGDWLERVEDALRLVGKADRKNVGVMFNLCHWLKVDKEENLKPLLTAAAPHLFAVSIHGADHAVDIQSGKGNWIQPLDSGAFDLYALLKLLNEVGYRGPVGLQCYGIQGDARDHLARSISAWKKLSERLAAPVTP